jgi:hypothetical protein
MTVPLDLAAIEELEQLDAVATPGEWVHVGGHGVGGSGQAVSCLGDDGPPDANTRYLIALRNAAPQLLAAARRLVELDRKVVDGEVTEHRVEAHGLLNQLRTETGHFRENRELLAAALAARESRGFAAGRASVTAKAEGWEPWTQDAAEEMEEGTVAWLTWRGIVQQRPYVWLFDENGEGGWFCAAPDGDDRIANGIGKFLRIPAPPAPADTEPKDERCPGCGAKEVESNTPRTTYACGSSDYDQRPGTFKQECSK